MWQPSDKPHGKGIDVKTFNPLAVTSVIALLIATPLWSQGAIVGTDQLDDEITDIEENVRDEIAKGEDAARYGAAEFAPGWTGGLSASVSANNGTTDTQEYAIAGRFRYGAGLWAHTFGFALEHSKSEGTVDKDRLFAIYDANRTITDRFYLFGLASYEDDLLPSAVLERDVFLGFGPGFRIVNTDTFAWRVQAGPGVRYTVDNATNDSTTEVSGIVSSRLYYRVSDVVFLTNDTDALYSEVGGTRLTNDFGISVALSDNLSSRLGYRSEWTDLNSSEPDNTINASLVLTF
jgi:putative salt-induced outer membrane protein